MFGLNRRKMFGTVVSFGTGIASRSVFNSNSLWASSYEQNQSKWDNEYTWGHTMLFMEEYHQGTMEIIGCLSGELSHVGDLTSRAANVIKNGGTVWNSMNAGHMVGFEVSEKVRGNPKIMKDHTNFENLNKGDMVFTNQCNKAVKAARDRGVYVVCVTVNYINNEFRPQGFTIPNEDNLMLKDVSNEILHSHVPYYQGLVHAPEIPEITLCPSTNTGLGTLYWMLNAEIANKLVEKSPKEIDKSAEYLKIVTKRIERVKEHMPLIRETAITMAHRIRAGEPGLSKVLSTLVYPATSIMWNAVQ